MGFKNRVLQIVADIPKGQVLTYLQVAKMAGNPKAARAVGNILQLNYLKNGANIPCHRVVRSDRKIGDFALGTVDKENLLLGEGVKITNHRVLL